MTEFKSHPEMVICCVADMTDEQRQEFVLSLPDESLMKKVIVEGIKTGEIKRCPKTDWCRLESEKKEEEEKQNCLRSKEQSKRLATLEARETMWETHARQQEATIKAQEERLAKAEGRLEKMAGLLEQMFPK